MAMSCCNQKQISTCAHRCCRSNLSVIPITQWGGGRMKRVLFLALVGCLISSVQVAAKDVVATSYCPMTGVLGTGRGKTFEVAKEAAIQACISKGGVSSCCYKFVRQVRG